MSESDLLRRITSDPAIFGGKPIVRGRRLAVEHVLSMLAAGDTPQDIVSPYPPEIYRFAGRRQPGRDAREKSGVRAGRRSCRMATAAPLRLLPSRAVSSAVVPSV